MCGIDASTAREGGGGLKLRRCLRYVNLPQFVIAFRETDRRQTRYKSSAERTSRSRERGSAQERERKVAKEKVGGKAGAGDKSGLAR